ncbi:MAG: nucleoside deaminase [Nitrospinae bacterium]|nr:nucleoside deaminase [Nitrospinota bacterium]
MEKLKKGLVPRLFIAFAVSAFVALGSAGAVFAGTVETAVAAAPVQATAASAAEERDQIFMLVALAVVNKDWQTTNGAGSRGYNIGSVLVDANNNVLWWARNCVNCNSNGTQHGEVRLMTQYQQATRNFSLKGYTIYTSLEPCAMCGGMMCMQSVARTVFAQKDPDFGDGIQRLALDSTKLGPPPAGYSPYPRTLPSVPSTLAFYGAINDAYTQWRNAGNTGLTKFLATPIAQKLYAAATNQLMTYQVQFPENQQVYVNALTFYRKIPTCPTGKICCDVPQTSPKKVKAKAQEIPATSSK